MGKRCEYTQEEKKKLERLDNLRRFVAGVAGVVFVCVVLFLIVLGLTLFSFKEGLSVFAVLLISIFVFANLGGS